MIKRIKNYISLAIGLLIISSCATKIPLAKNYFQNQTIVGVIYNIDSIAVYKEGPQGLLDVAFTAGKKFKEPLKVVDENINQTEKIKELYNNLFKSKGKKLVEIDFDYNVDKLSEFKNTGSSDKKFHKYNLKELKEKGIDELLIVNLKYGLLVSYYGFIETGKEGYCRIDSEIVNLSDNSIIFKDFSTSKEKIDGKWKTPPNYENLENSIKKAIEKVINIEKTKLDI